MKNLEILNLVRENIKTLKPYSSARSEFSGLDKELIFLDANENPFENSINRYPDSYQFQLKSKLSNLKEISIENIFLGNGSDEIIDLIIRAFCEPKSDRIITLPPTYGMYDVLAKINDVENVKVLLDREFQIDTFEILEKMSKQTKLIFICSPNNPTGNLMDKEDVKFVLENFNGLVIIDEAYIDFSMSDSWIKEIDNYTNLIVLQTFSKAYGMAGIRLGVCYSNKQIIEILNKIKPPYNINQLSQNKAIDVLENLDKIKKQLIDIKISREILLQELKTLKFVKKIYPSDSNFVLIKVDDANKRYKQLIDNRVVVRNRNTEPLCTNCLRITIGTGIEMEKLVRIFKEMEI